MLGKIAYKTYYQPKGIIKTTFRQGVYNTWQINQGKNEMRRASATLQQVVYEDKLQESLPEICFLTGKKFWFMTAFCAYSLSKVYQTNIKFVFYDDGTLDHQLRQKIKAQFAISEIVDQDQIEQRLEEFLPENKYPLLHYKRRTYPHIKKLTDVHAGSTGYRLLLDSDMLFFKTPDAMLSWLEQPEAPFYIVDRLHSYYYSDALMEELAGCSVPPKVNVGAIGLQSESIDWDQVEHWAKHMEEKEGSDYLLEQALTAMLIADKTCTVAPPEEYIVMPTLPEVKRQTGVLHHYVAGSKEWYFKHAWKTLQP